MNTTTQAFAIHIPDANGESTERIVSIDVPVRWDELIDEWVLTEEAHEMIDRRKALEMGLLTPAQLRELRERHQQNQKQMGALFQVGEKSWSRWESGKHRPTRSINLLIRALYDGEISIDYLRKRSGLAIEDSPVANVEVWWSAVRSFRENRQVSQSSRAVLLPRAEAGFRATSKSAGPTRRCRSVSVPGRNHEFDISFASAS
jgi:transcriptional regulator with XRE-family HTH domain